MKDINVEAMDNAVDIATREAETKLARMESEIEAVREESRALGVLQKINCDSAHNELIKYVTLYQIKQHKEYKKGGLSWEEFCEACGEQRRTVENKLKDIRPFAENFSENFSGLLKVPFNKIRYLGRSIAEKPENFSEIEDGNIYIDDTKIPLAPENKGEIEAAIDTLIDTHKKEQKELNAKLARAKKNTDKIVEEETKGLMTERDALVKEVARLKPLDIEDRDISWCEDHLKEMQGLCVDFEKLARKGDQVDPKDKEIQALKDKVNALESGNQTQALQSKADEAQADLEKEQNAHQATKQEFEKYKQDQADKALASRVDDSDTRSR